MTADAPNCAPTLQAICPGHHLSLAPPSPAESLSRVVGLRLPRPHQLVRGQCRATTSRSALTVTSPSLDMPAKLKAVTSALRSRDIPATGPPTSGSTVALHMAVARIDPFSLVLTTAFSPDDPHCLDKTIDSVKVVSQRCALSHRNP